MLAGHLNDRKGGQSNEKNLKSLAVVPAAGAGGQRALGLLEVPPNSHCTLRCIDYRHYESKPGFRSSTQQRAAGGNREQRRGHSVWRSLQRCSPSASL